jgi:3-dehydroquinate synthetase
LNFGHTFGHVFESAMAYSHGFSVLWGMYNELNFFNSLNLLDDNFFKKVIYLLQKLTNTNIFTLKIKSQFVKLIRDDKKGNSNVVYMPVLKDFGKVDILPIRLSDIERFFMENLTF